MLGPYRIERRIGRGGMGSVYEAVDDRAGARVALKVLSPELAQRPDFVARFQRESRALAGLSHDRIAKVYFSGAAEGLPFFAMEYVDGKNLEEVLLEEGVFAPAKVVELMREAALGLRAAAERGIIHRDVKPTNLLLDSTGNLRIVDFGLAKAVDSQSRLTITGAVVGTPFYLSPEQGLGKAVDQRSDIYSLGATFYHLLCGGPPFDAESPVSIIMKHINDAPTPITQRRGGLPEPLSRVVMRCLAKDPRRRYQDYEELTADLDAIARGEPVSAPPVDESIRRSQPSFVVVDDLDEGSLLLRRATVLRRGLGLLMDLVALWVMYLILGKLVPAERFDPALLFLPVSFAYLAIGDGSGGNSLGKRFFRLRVGRPDGSPPGTLRAFGRALLLIPTWSVVLWFRGDGFAQMEDVLRLLARLSYVTTPLPEATLEMIARGLLGLVGIDLLAVLFTRRAQTLHDLASGTAVFREDRVRRRAPPSGARDPRPIAPAIPLIASIVPGIGQLINGQVGKMLLVYIALAFCSFFPGLMAVVYVGQAAEAWLYAKRRRDQAFKG